MWHLFNECCYIGINALLMVILEGLYEVIDSWALFDCN